MKTIGIIGAMEEEVSYIQHKMEVIATKKVVNLEFSIGRLLGCNLVLVHCGIGKVNAAVCTSVMINQFAADYVINVGVAGAISTELDIGNIVISTDTVQHDFDATAYGYSEGTIPRMPVSIFEADNNLIDIAKSSAIELGWEEKVFTGRIASGDQFVSSKPLKDKIWKNFKAMCVEMEGAAIAQTCYLNKIPFVVIRAISDKADATAEVDFQEFVDKAAKNSSDLVEKMLSKLNP